MPPKNKKQLEEQALREQEQRKKREEEQARLEAERLKYAGETLPTGLFLPVSPKLLKEFHTYTLKFVEQKLLYSIGREDQGFKDKQSRNYIIQQLIKAIHSATKQYSFQNQKDIKKVQVLLGIQFLLVNDSDEKSGISSIQEQKNLIAKAMLKKHTLAGQKHVKIFEKVDIDLAMQFLGQAYFSHLQLLSNFKNFQKRKDEKFKNLYISLPTTYQNQRDTVFIDLTQKKSEKEEQKLQSPPLDEKS